VRNVFEQAPGIAEWTRVFPSRSGLYRTRVRVRDTDDALEEEDLVAVALLHDGRLAFSRLMLQPAESGREWLGPLLAQDLKTPDRRDAY
jgi:hypothetical protein